MIRLTYIFGISMALLSVAGCRSTTAKRITTAKPPSVAASVANAQPVTQAQTAEPTASPYASEVHQAAFQLDEGDGISPGSIDLNSTGPDNNNSDAAADDIADATSPIDVPEPPQPPAQDENDLVLVSPTATTPGSDEGKHAPPESGNLEELPPPPADPQPTAVSLAPTVGEVISSVRNHFPLVQAAAADRIIASGEQLSATGAFDRKLEGYNNIQPVDFFENHWYQWSLKRDTLWGGQVGASYKLGRGTFEPWYLERETNDLGEFGLTIVKPFARDIEIDENRAALWRSQLERRRVEPAIRAQLISAVRDGAGAYWKWVAAGADVRIAEGILQLGLERVEFLEKEVELGARKAVDLVDNQRAIVSRQAKLIDAQRKLQQTQIKLSLFLRTATGQPRLLPTDIKPPEFPGIDLLDEATLAGDTRFAVANRPELAELGIVRRQLNVDLRQAYNETRAEVDGGLFFGQDVGNPTASDNKSEFEIEATLTVSVPLERRKALGKIRQTRGKMQQLAAKTQFAREKVGGEVLIARAALIAAARRVEQTTRGVELARRMQEVERQYYDEDQSTLFNLNLREQQAAEAGSALVGAQLDYYLALAEYSAALGLDNSELFDGAPNAFSAPANAPAPPEPDDIPIR